ncbi:hypothetical protein R6Q59_028462 [Mikania micrantha]
MMCMYMLASFAVQVLLLSVQVLPDKSGTGSGFNLSENPEPPVATSSGFLPTSSQGHSFKKHFQTRLEAYASTRGDGKKLKTTPIVDQKHVCSLQWKKRKRKNQIKSPTCLLHQPLVGW